MLLFLFTLHMCYKYLLVIEILGLIPVIFVQVMLIQIRSFIRLTVLTTLVMFEFLVNFIRAYIQFVKDVWNLYKVRFDWFVEFAI